MFEKAVNFLFRSESALYTWILLAGGLGVVGYRLIQVVGAIALVRQSWCDLCKISPAPAVMFLLWLCFILAVSGPVASPKYRLPMEPVLNVLTAIGFCRLCERNSRRGERR